MAFRIALLTVGTELLSGEMSDTNTRCLCQHLADAGYVVDASLTVGDDEKAICDALCLLSERFDTVIVCGGLGGTGDDLTARAAAHAFGRRLCLSDEALRQIRQRMTAAGRTVQAQHEKMALMPQKSTPLGNPVGIAPGFSCQWHTTFFYFLPGVPRELEAMISTSLLPKLYRLAPTTPIAERRLKLFGLRESEVERLVNGCTLPDGLRVGYGVDFPFVTLKLSAVGEEAAQRVDRAEAAVLKVLGVHLFGREETTLAEATAELLTRAQQTLALAESCTGGMIAQQLTAIPGSSTFLDRCGVVYANRAKQSWLGVPEDLLCRKGAVSHEVAQAMAAGIRRTAATDIGLSVTGIAGPDGATPRKPVGTVFIGLATDGGVRVNEYHFAGDREQVRLASAATALDLIRRHLIDSSSVQA